METETPAPGQRARGWLLAALGVALVALVAYQMWPEASATPAGQTSNRRTVARGPAAASEIDPAELKVKLEALKATREDFGEGERNPFRFQRPRLRHRRRRCRRWRARPDRGRRHRLCRRRFRPCP
jgi:hypothetical protein